MMDTYKPKTPLGEKLLAIRDKAIKKGMKLLSTVEIEKELEDRRK